MQTVGDDSRTQAQPAGDGVAADDPGTVTAPRPRGLRRVASAAGTVFDVGGATRLPLVTLFGLNLVDEFDRLTFSTLTPEIRDAFDLTDQQIVAIGSVSSIFVMLAAIPVGYLTDRVPRLRLARIAAVVWGTMAVLMGAAWAVGVLFVARFFSGIARSSNEIVHTGLLADYYEPKVLPRVFQVHRMANPLSQVASLVAAGIAVAFGWRWAFILLAIPTFFLVLTLNRLREPHRGATIDAEAARAAATLKPPAYRRATRQILGIRTLRRVLVGFFVFGIGVIAFGQMLSLFFEDVYDFGPFGRGLVSFVYGAGMLAGIVVGGRAGLGRTARGEFPALVKISAGSFLAFSAGTFLMALAPWAPLSLLALVAAAVGLGVVIPVFPSILVRILPPQVRAQGQSFTLVAIAVGGLFAIPIAGLGESGGYRPALVIVAVTMALSTPVVYSAHRFMGQDIERADAALLVSFAPGSNGAAPEVGAGLLDDDDWFPILDYDRLTAAQIVRLLPKLYVDEMPLVEERERAGKNRRSILGPLEQLLVRSAGAPDDVVVGEWVRANGSRRR